jgi:hypothetical protein
MAASTELQPVDPMMAIVLPPLPIQQILERWRTIQELKKALLDRDDIIEIAGKPYIKKSGWRKLAYAFNLSDEIIREEKEEREGEVIWRVWVKVTAKNGRYAVGVGSASTRERQSWTHEEHDVYALAHTRAKNRAISDILGLGLVSAEEVTGVNTEKPVTVSPKEDTYTKLTQMFKDEVDVGLLSIEKHGTEARIMILQPIGENLYREISERLEPYRASYRRFEDGRRGWSISL